MIEVKRGHLTGEERDLITILHAKCKTVREIARETGRSAATISRELNRKEAVYLNGDYIGSQTHKRVKEQWASSHHRKKLANPEIKEYVIKAIEHKWSPQLIAGRLRAKFGLSMHHETIYRFIREKGTVENINGLIRRFFPKKTDFDLVSDAQLQYVEDWINNRPMKILNFKTPNEKFKELTGVTIA
jgi:IS30 family transposase